MDRRTAHETSIASVITTTPTVLIQHTRRAVCRRKSHGLQASHWCLARWFTTPDELKTLTILVGKPTLLPECHGLARLCDRPTAILHGQAYNSMDESTSCRLHRDAPAYPCLVQLQPVIHGTKFAFATELARPRPCNISIRDGHEDLEQLFVHVLTIHAVHMLPLRASHRQKMFRMRSHLLDCVRHLANRANSFALFIG